jgi:hypothetical protein
MDVDEIIEEVESLQQRQEEAERFEALTLLRDLLVELRDLNDPFKGGIALRKYLERLTNK